MTEPLEELKGIKVEQVIWDELVEEIREKYRVSWEKSIETFESFGRIQDEDFKCAIKYGYFLPRISIESIVVNAKPRKLRAEYSLEVKDDLKYIIHPEDYEHLTEALDTSFFGKLKWGWKLFALSWSDWKDAMGCEDYVEEFFYYLGYSKEL